MDITLYPDDVGAGDHPTVNVDASYGFAGGNGGADINMGAYVGGADRGVSVNFTITNQYSHQVPDTGAGNIGRGWTIVSVPAQNNGTQNSGQQPHAPAAKPQTHPGLRGRGGTPTMAGWVESADCGMRNVKVHVCKRFGNG